MITAMNLSDSDGSAPIVMQHTQLLQDMLTHLVSGSYANRALTFIGHLIHWFVPLDVIILRYSLIVVDGWPGVGGRPVRL